MSTRCNIHFDGWGKTIANIYRHSDGYPDGVLPDLEQFFADVEAQTDDTRFSDASYLAAKFIVWQAKKFARKLNWDTMEYEDSESLDFLSLGIVNEDAGDGEYVYTVNCDDRDENGRPTISHRPAGIRA